MNPLPPLRPFLSRRQFLATTVASGVAAAAPENPASLLGPILGDATESTAMVWMRAGEAGTFTLELIPEPDGPKQLIPAEATPASDFCIHWKAEGLAPATTYRYRILSGSREIAADPGQRLTTPPAPGTPSRVRIAISSCAREDAGSREVWLRMAAEQVDAVMLIGDTPYIDSTVLETQSRRHREFAAVAEYQALLRSRPCWWTWDDHDFAGNDATGLAAGKENSRTVFSRYRPQRSYGDGNGGIYTSFRRGPLEVFLLDTRWYAMTEPSFAASHKPTLLGRNQWEWLQKGLLSSTAPFKLLASGIIWDDKQNSESDDWGTYLHELTAIRKFIGSRRIPGVILMGGDIHASRVLRYQTAATAGYDLVQFIASPIHGGTIPSLNIFHPDLVRSAVEPHVFLRIDADSTTSPATFRAALINRHGDTVFSYHLSADDLKPKD